MLPINRFVQPCAWTNHTIDGGLTWVTILDRPACGAKFGARGTPYSQTESDQTIEKVEFNNVTPFTPIIVILLGNRLW